MAIDGTYGRLSGHNQRFKELRRKKQERKEHNIRKNSLNKISYHESKTHFNTVNPEELNTIKLEIQKRAKHKSHIEICVFVLSLVIAYLIFYFLFIK
jgi:hypothetical protein